MTVEHCTIYGTKRHTVETVREVLSESEKKSPLDLFQRAANLGQVYSIAAMIRTAAEEAQTIGGLCLEQKHIEGIGLMATQANALCAVLMSEWDKIKLELLQKQ